MGSRTIIFLLTLGLSLQQFTSSGSAAAVEYTTGNLGNNIIFDAGDFVITPHISTPSPILPAEIEVKYGLWNSPDVDVDVLLNSNLVGSFTAKRGYLSPGPEFISFDITGSLVDGVNEVKFTGNHIDVGDYVIGQVWIRYHPVPEPATLSICLLAVAGMSGRAWGRSKKR